MGLDKAVTKLASEAVDVSARTITREVEMTLVAILLRYTCMLVTQTSMPHLPVVV